MTKLETINAEDLQNRTYEPTPFLVDELIPEGLHILAGAPKIGKSWLALWLCLCVAQGQTLWNFTTTQGEVLYLSLEDSFQRIQTRLFDLTEAAPPTLHFAIMADTLKHGLAHQIEKKGLEPFVSGVSLGASPEVDAPKVNTQFCIRGTGREAEVVEKMYFDRLLDFVYAEFMMGLQRGFVPKRCANCGRWFLQTPGATFAYCAGPAPEDPSKTCREIGAASSFKDKVANNEVWQVQQRAYKKYYARTMRKDMTKAEFEAWTRDAEQKRDAALEPYARAESEEERQRIVAELEEKLNRL